MFGTNVFDYLAPFALFFALIVALIIIKASVKILREYERAVVFTLGRFQKVKGPGVYTENLIRID